MKVFAPALVTISAINATGWDASLICPAAFTITVDHIAETTVGHGVELNTIGNTTRGAIMTLGGGSGP
jgi:hypothetical protein